LSGDVDNGFIRFCIHGKLFQQQELTHLRTYMYIQ
jgi:hypothetical protein